MVHHGDGGRIGIQHHLRQRILWYERLRDLIADGALVRNKIAEFFNTPNQLVLRMLTPDKIAVAVNDSTVSVILELEHSMCNMLRSSDALKELADFLDLNFNHDISVNL